MSRFRPPPEARHAVALAQAVISGAPRADLEAKAKAILARDKDFRTRNDQERRAELARKNGLIP